MKTWIITLAIAAGVAITAWAADTVSPAAYRFRGQLNGHRAATTIMGIAHGTVTIKATGRGTVTIAVGSNDDCNSSHCSDTGSGPDRSKCVVCLGWPSGAAIDARDG